MTQMRRFDTRAYMAAQAVEALGPVNRYYAGQALGGDPSPDDCWRHWCASKAADWFRAVNHSRFLVETDTAEDAVS